MKEEVKNVDNTDNSVEPVQVSQKVNADNIDTAGEKNLIKGKFKTYEDLEVAYDNAEKKLTQTSQKLAQLEKEVNDSKVRSSSNSERYDASSDSDYMEYQKNLLLKYMPYSLNRNARSIEEFIAGLPPKFASQFGADLRELRAGFEFKARNAAKYREECTKQAVTQAVQDFEEQNKGQLGNTCKKMAFDFYTSFGQFAPEQANAVLELTDKIISAYEAEKALNQQLADENNLAKSKLTSSSTSSSAPSVQGQHIFTRAEIQEMIKTPVGREKFLKVEKLIFDQMAKGLIK